MYGGPIQRAQEPADPRAQCLEEERHVRRLLTGRTVPGDGGVRSCARREGLGPSGEYTLTIALISSLSTYDLL